MICLINIINMLLKVDKRTWIEIPNDSTEEYKKEKIRKYAEENKRKLESLKHNNNLDKTPTKQHKIGAIYDKRVNLRELITNCL